MSMTIYDIAKQAGVSASTVSRVINNKPGIGKVTRQKVQKLLDENNFLMDENARNLVMQQNHTIGILTDNLLSLRQSRGLAIIQNTILKNGYYCFVRYTGEQENALEEGIKAMAMKRVEGLLLMGASFADHRKMETLIRSYLKDTPVVLVHQVKTLPLDNVYAVGADERIGFRECVQRLARRGRKHIALLIDKGRVSRELIRSTFTEATAAIPEIESYVYEEVPSTRSDAGEAVETVMKEHPETDALICASDTIAIGAMYRLQEHGRNIPEEISIIGEDNSELCEASNPRLTSLDTMLDITTVMSAQVLMSVLEGIERTHTIVVKMELVERETV